MREGEGGRGREFFADGKLALNNRYVIVGYRFTVGETPGFSLLVNTKSIVKGFAC